MVKNPVRRLLETKSEKSNINKVRTLGCLSLLKIGHFLMLWLTSLHVNNTLLNENEIDFSRDGPFLIHLLWREQ